MEVVHTTHVQMKSSALSGAFAFAMLLLLPRASALTVTQTLTSSTSGNVEGDSSLSLSSMVTGQQFNLPGHLTKVDISVSFTAGLGSFEYNPFTRPPYPFYDFTHSIYLDTHFFIAQVNSPSFFDGPSFHDVAHKNPFTLQPGYSDSFSATFGHSFDYALTSPNDLSLFIGTTPLLVSFNSRACGSNSYGYLGGTENTSVTITYTYTIPDGGSSALLAEVGALGIACLHWKVRRRVGNI